MAMDKNSWGNYQKRSSSKLWSADIQFSTIPMKMIAESCCSWGHSMKPGISVGFLKYMAGELRRNPLVEFRMRTNLLFKENAEKTLDYAIYLVSQLNKWTIFPNPTFLRPTSAYLRDGSWRGLFSMLMLQHASLATFLIFPAMLFLQYTVWIVKGLFSKMWRIFLLLIHVNLVFIGRIHLVLKV